MKLEYRCANCGNPLKRPEDRCKLCGYQRGKGMTQPDSDSMFRDENDPIFPDTPFNVFDEEDEELPSQKQSEKKTGCSWLIILLALLPIVSRVGPEIKDSIKDTLKEIGFLEKTYSENFETVSVIIAAKDLVAGQTIDLSDLSISSVPRSSVPPNAVAPLNVENIIGIKIDHDISANQILLFDPCN